ncbi:MAG TPA: carboxylating nicotinate-nucleotide diphosphorylase [Elusimicrobiota bacterium]|nr:carboxylating nicotinate-nucleotide diphosphorylase [Elusimicrobiota bacterium]
MTTQEIIRAALREDLGERGDVTTRFFVPKGARLRGKIIAKAPGVVCGADVARKVFLSVSPSCRIRVKTKDGRPIKPGQVVMEVAGGPKILTAERTALNFLQHLSGVATLTARYVERTAGTKAKILDTRKTLPGWRELEKYAVRCGGGENHRIGLYDAVLLKDNHWSLNRHIREAVAQVRRRYPRMTIEIEAANIGQVERALQAGADIILLDNMTSSLIRRAIRVIRKERPSTRVEISGGVHLENVRALARLGPDRISIGRITHSAPALDMSLEIE